MSDRASIDGQLSPEHPEVVVCSVDPSDLPERSPSMEVDSDATIVGGVAPSDDQLSISKMTRSQVGKRRRREVQSDSGDNDSDVGFARRLRSRKTRVLDTTVDDEDRSDFCPHSRVPSPLAISTPGDAGSSVRSDPETASETKKKKRCTKKKSSPIAPKMHPVLDPGQLDDHTAASLAALAMDWISDIELIRVRSAGMQGVISRYIKERLEIIRECFRILHDQSMRADDPNQLRLRNARLVAELRSAQEDNEKLRLDIVNLNIASETQQTAEHIKETRSVGTSPVRGGDSTAETDKNIVLEEEIAKIKSRISLLESGVHKWDEMEPLPQRKPRAKPVIKSITEINPPRRVTIIDNTSTFGSRSLGGTYLADPADPGPVDSLGPGPGPPAPGPSASADPVPEKERKKVNTRSSVDPGSDVPLGPRESGVLIPKKEKKEVRYKSSDTEGKSKDEDSEHWKTVTRKRKRKKLRKRDARRAKEDDVRRDQEGTQTGGEEQGKKDEKRLNPSSKPNKPVSSPPSTGKSAIQILQKRLPKASAVVIKGKSDNFSYADALVKLRKQIPLAEIGISSTKIKKTAGGAVLIEVPGADSKGLAEELRSRAAQVLGEDAVVVRPEIKGEIRIVGFDESVGVADISKGVAKAGDCNVSEVTVTPITPMRNGLYMTWVKCPLASAIKASKCGKIPLGWTMARLELLKPRVARCFRCWEPGHHQRLCRSENDRSRSCFRCGDDGHSAASCERETHCVLCAARGLHARHRTGSHGCATVENLNIESSVRRPITVHASYDS